MVRAMEPALVGVLMALQTVIVHHERPRGNKIASGRACERGMEVVGAFRGPDLVPLARIVRVEKDHADHRHAHSRSPTYADAPLDAWACESMQDVHPDREEWSDDVSPLSYGADVRVFELESFHAHES